MHTEDAYKHFWPFTEWRFISPISYWDSASYGDIVGAVDAVVVIVLLALLYRLGESKYVRGGIIVLGVLYFVVLVVQLGQVSLRL